MSLYSLDGRFGLVCVDTQRRLGMGRIHIEIRIRERGFKQHYTYVEISNLMVERMTCEGCMRESFASSYTYYEFTTFPLR